MSALIPVVIYGSSDFMQGIIIPLIIGPKIFPLLGRIEIVQGAEAEGPGLSMHTQAQAYKMPLKMFSYAAEDAVAARDNRMLDYCYRTMRDHDLPGYCFVFWDGKEKRSPVFAQKATACGMEVELCEYMPHHLYASQLLKLWQDKFKNATP